MAESVTHLPLRVVCIDFFQIELWRKKKLGKIKVGYLGGVTSVNRKKSDDNQHCFVDLNYRRASLKILQIYLGFIRHIFTAFHPPTPGNSYEIINL